MNWQDFARVRHPLIFGTIIGLLVLLFSLPIMILFGIAANELPSSSLKMDFSDVPWGILWITGFAGGLMGVILNVRKLLTLTVNRAKDFDKLNDLTQQEAQEIENWINTGEIQAAQVPDFYKRPDDEPY